MTLAAARRLTLGLLAASTFLATVPASLPASAAPAPLQLPVLNWQPKSDWISVKAAGAVGDGVTDDTAAIKKVLDKVQDGDTIYFPPGTYRITSTLNYQNNTSTRLTGAALIGNGRDTKIVWDGPAGGDMFLINGTTTSRYIGLDLDGRGKAANGFHYQSIHGFQTEVTHRDLAFRNFTDSGILENHTNSQLALAETSFDNCLFVDCGRGVAFINWNDYDYTFDGDVFRHCGVALDNKRGNFYVRDCRFEGSTDTDISDWSEHGSSIRRCVSVGSASFLKRITTVGPITIQDCHVDSWTDPKGAIQLTRPPVTMFDCLFTNPPKDAAGNAIAPVRGNSDGQKLLVSNVTVKGAPLVQPLTKPDIIEIPAGKIKVTPPALDETWYSEKMVLPKRIFDAVRDFGAKPDGRTDDTAAVQAAIDAAAKAGDGAQAYLPTGRYIISKTLNLSGHDYSVSGSGWHTFVMWRGAEGGTIVSVQNPQHITLADMSIGTGDAGPMNDGYDILQTGSGGKSYMTYDGVYVFGMYAKQPLKQGVYFDHLGAGDVVVLPHIQGNLRFHNCGAATILGNCTYEGSITVDGKDKARDGLLGIQTRLATGVTYGLFLHDDNNIVMSDFYTEQGDNGYYFSGSPDDPAGRATISGAKMNFPTSTDPTKATALDIDGYHGLILFGPDQFYTEPVNMRIRQKGGGPLDMYLIGCSWYGTQPDLEVTPAITLHFVGNEHYGTDANQTMANNELFMKTPTAVDLGNVSLALDDLRRLGEADLHLNYGRR